MRVNTLNRLSWGLVYTDTRQAQAYAREALKLARQYKYLRGEYVANNFIGIASDVVSRYDSALFYYHASLNGSIIAHDTQSIASNLTNIGLTHWHIGNFKEALEYNFEALPYFEKLNDINDMALLNNNIGLIYSDMKSWNKAKEFFLKACKMHRKTGNMIGYGACLNNLGKLYYFENDFSRARLYLDSAIHIQHEKKDFYGLAIAYKDLGILQSASGNPGEAISLMQKSLFYAKQIGDENEMSATNLEMSSIFLKQGQTRKALSMVKEAEATARKIRSRKLIFRVFQQYSQIYEKTGNPGKALEYYKLYKSTEDSVLNDQQLNKLYELELKHQAAQSADRIALLTRQQEIQELRLERKNIFISVFLVFFVVIMIMLFFFYRGKRHQQQILLDNALYQERERKGREVIEAEIRERRRIGEELHDGLGQILSMIKLRLTSISEKDDSIPGKNKEKITDIILLTDQAFSELRTISHNMAPIFLQERGLAAALRDQLDRISKSNNYKVYFFAEGIEKTLDPFLESTLYRIAQEMLNNIIKHAKATEIYLQVISDGQEVTLIAEDNGKGFEMNDDSGTKGIGLKNIFSRAENLGGHVLIDSAPNRGTILTVLIPLKEKYDGSRR